MASAAQDDHHLVLLEARGRWRTRSANSRAAPTQAGVHRRLHRVQRTADPPRSGRRAAPRPARCGPGVSAVPARARNATSWVGNRPRVRSRRASRAVLVEMTRSSSPVRARPAAFASRARVIPSGTAARCGSTSREMAPSMVRRAASSASMIRDPGPGQLLGRPVELGDVCRELRLQPDVAEGDGGLVGQRLEQSYVGRHAVSRHRARPGCCRAPPARGGRARRARRPPRRVDPTSRRAPVPPGRAAPRPHPAPTPPVRPRRPPRAAASRPTAPRRSGG